MMGPSKLCSYVPESMQVLVQVQKGFFKYPYFPKGDVKAVFGIEASLKGMCWYPAWESNVEKIFHTIQLGEDVFNLGHRPDKLYSGLYN